MAQGKASDRLNDILTQGSSVKTASAVSVLDKSLPTTPVDTSTATGSLLDDPSPTPLHGDQEVPDMSKLLHQNDTPEEQDMDAMFQKMFASAGVNTEDPQNPQEASAKFFADLMKAMSEEGGDAHGIPGTQVPDDTSYQQKLALYQTYRQSVWKARFLVVRFILHTLNFVYHYRELESFGASPYSFIRTALPDSSARTFFTYFISAEIAIISGYFTVMAKEGLLAASSRNSAILKVLSLVSGLYPPARSLQPIVDNALVYWSGFMILFSDLMLLVVYFGIASVAAR